MSFGVGVGDIIQLARIASRLSTSFSSGPTGAASEFNEIKSQLSSLSIILEALARETGKPGRNVEDARNKEKLGEMVDGCKATLRRLESIVEKYTDKLDSSWSWKIWFSKGYKLILWTTDGGDIRALKDDLHRHYVMIDSYVNVADLQQALNVLERMLTEKKHRRSLSLNSTRNGQSVLRPEATHVSSSSRPKTFEGFPPFFATMDIGYRRAAKVKMNFSISRRNPMASICREATVNPDFFLGGSIISNQPMFCCNCNRIMKSVFTDSHHAALAKIKCGPGTIIVKNESSDLIQREYTLYAPRIDGPEAKREGDFDDRPYIISIPLRKNQRAFEASLVTFLSHQAARCLADGVIPESKWVRWENDVVESKSTPSNGDLFSPWSPGNGSRGPPSKQTRGRVLVACSVRLGISAEGTMKNMNIRYIPPNNSNWSDSMTVNSLMIIQYRSIRKQKLYQVEDDDPAAWQDGDYLKMYLEFARVSEYLKMTKSLRCDFVWEEKIRIMGPAVTFKVRELRHFEDDLPVEGAGTLSYLGERVTLTAGASGEIQLDRWNLPKLPSNKKAATNESAFLVAWTQPLHEQLRSFWASRISRKEEVKATFILSNISIKGRPDMFHQEFYGSQLVILHDWTTRSTRIVVRSASGNCVITQDVSDRKATKLDLHDEVLSIDEPMANVTNLVLGREKDGPSLNIRQEPNTLHYRFSDDQDAVACICMITELGRGEFIMETMALEDAISGPLSGMATLALSETTEMAPPPPIDLSYQSPRSSGTLLAELPSNHVRRPSFGQAQVLDTSKGYELDVEIYLDEARQNMLCPHATVNPALFLSFDAIGQAALPLFACRCKTGNSIHSLVQQHELGDYRAGGFTLPILALSPRTGRSPGCFVIVNVIAKDLVLELYIRCPNPQKERQFEEVMASLLRMRVATNLAIVGLRPSQEMISVHTEDVETISVISAFGNIEMSPSADIRIDGEWRFLSQATKEVSISQHRVVHRGNLADRLSQDPSRHGNLFNDGGKSMLQFKSGERNFTCYIRGAPKFHSQENYITLTMQVDDAVLLPPDNIVGYNAGERLGSGKLRLRFEGGGRAVQQVASQSFGWFSFWRNRLKMKRWFNIDEDERKEYESPIEEAAVDTDNPKFFHSFFNNGKLAILKDDDLNSIRIFVQSFSNDRVLSQDVVPSFFTRERSVKASIEACCTGERTFTLSHDSAIADRPADGTPRCWRMNGAASYMFPTRQLRDNFCENLARAVGAIMKGPEEVDEGVFELDSASTTTPSAVELPTFEFSMPTLLRRATIRQTIPAEMEENDEESDHEPEVPEMPLPNASYQNLGLGLGLSALESSPGRSIRPSRSFVRERRGLSPAPSPSRRPVEGREAPSSENASRRTTPSPKPALFIPPPPPLPSFPDELAASPILGRPQKMLSSPPKSAVSNQSTIASSAASTRSVSSSHTLVHSRSPSRTTNITYRVWAQYDAKKDGEINVKVGDLIRVDHEDDEADAVWGFKMQSKARVEGWVPKWCLTQVGNLDFNIRGRRKPSGGGEG
ncbi:hypothetical protein H072_1088 [Dactylellina haptotyla CBS 200.50]|uniref:SH3 domain-containing protein n=1 Tax=Dactylellina haptotyla (strain CBS 200.50) TaxID=1284197 RepID=S8CB75_DACHA|nr:hypothetical protein H072_1088 [Dactylellina haptotyla CBS 200.50]